MPLLAVLAAAVAAAPAAHVVFSRPFSPNEGIVKGPERPYRAEVCLNGRWRFQPVPVPAGYRRDQGAPPELPRPSADRWESTALKVPSPWNVNRWGSQGRGDQLGQPYHTDSVYYPSYPRSWDGVEMGWLERAFTVPADWRDRRVILHFEAVAGECQVWVNGSKAGEHFDSFLPFELDVTDLVRRDGPNVLQVGVRAAALFNRQSARYRAFRAPYPPGSTLDRITGIWQDVYLLGLPRLRASDTFVQPRVNSDTLAAEVTLTNDTGQEHLVRVGAQAYQWVNEAPRETLSWPEPRWRLGPVDLTLPADLVSVPAHGTATVTLGEKVRGRLTSWQPRAPMLYGLVVTVELEGAVVDRQYTRFGWRQFEIVGRELRLNRQRIQLVGDLLHPFGPYIGSRRYAWAWYRMIKDAGGNAVRLHAQPMPRHFLDLADEMGLCVLDETALFGSSIQINLEDPAAWPRFEAHYDGLVLRDRNHPSVFGWSCGNELFALFFDVPDPDRSAYYERLGQYAQRARRLDPTRDWISCDGDEDLRGAVPVWSRHYGHGLPELPEVAKPRMVGESGGSYYATPGQLAVFDGDRAYESYRGRNEALGIDLYQNLVRMAQPKLAYFSPSELAWFGIEHLPLGYRDHSRPPGPDDGILFGPYVEGRPGVQLERIPPYAMTLNPGLDPKLPLYRPLPMFDAMKAATAPGGPRPWPAPHAEAPARYADPRGTIKAVAYAGDRSSALYRRLYALGTPFVPDTAAGSAAMLIVDGEQITPQAARRLKPVLGALLARGGTALLMLRRPETDVKGLAALLPAPVSVTARTATQLAPDRRAPATRGWRLADLYFAEDSADPRIAKCGLAGPFVAKGNVLLRAGDTDWTLFNRQPEDAKCSNVLVYEQMVKPSGAALVETKVGKGRLIVSTLDYVPSSPAYVAFWRRLLGTVGVRMEEPRTRWILPTALASGRGYTWRYTTAEPPAGWERPEFDDSGWRTGEAGFGTDTPGSRVRTPWTTGDIWLRATVTLPADAAGDLTLHLYHDEDVEVYVNGVKVLGEPGFVTEYKTYKLAAEARRAFHAGTNAIAVHCHQTAGGQYIDLGLSLGDMAPPAGPREHNLLLDGPAK